MTDFDALFSDRIHDVPRSFIREILKVALEPDVISFAGGLPDRTLFPVEALRDASLAVLSDTAHAVLQYGTSDGFAPLREWIAARYREEEGLAVSADDILITNGSQQGLDLIAKVLLNEGDGVILEEPGYLGAIQAFSMYRARFWPVPVSEHGLDTERLADVLARQRHKLMYAVPNFQNPSGVSYPESNRRAVADLLSGTDTLLVEDDPYGALRFTGHAKPSFRALLGERCIRLGSFSKTLVPGLRLGWMVAPSGLMPKLIAAKQATDLHTSHFTQAMVHHYLCTQDFDTHIASICAQYGERCQAMRASIARHFPAEVHCTAPEGGMFLWAELPRGMTAMALFERAVTKGIVFVPGDPFYVRGGGQRTLRLNFSCVDRNTIEQGIARLGDVIARLA